MLTEQQKRKLAVDLENLIWKFLNKASGDGIDLPLSDDFLGTRMTDAALIVLIHSDEVQNWLRTQGYLKDD